MDIQSFLRLNKKMQSELLYNDAIYISKRKSKSLTALLYQLDFFYVEIFYSKYRYNIISIKCFTNTDILDAYPEDAFILEHV